jgi:cytochrome P450
MVGAGGPGAGVTLAELARDPHPVHARLREVAPVCWVPALDGWLVTRRDLVLQVLVDPGAFTVQDERFSTAQVVGPSMLSLDGPEHRRHRRPFVAGFRGADARTAQRALVVGLAAELVAAGERRGRLEVRTEVAGPLATGVMAAVLGLPDVGMARLAGWYQAIVGSVSGISAGHPPTDAGVAAFGELSAAVLAALDAADPPLRRSCTKRPPAGASTPTGSVLAPAAREAELTPAELVSNAAVVMFGGIETTEATTATAVLHLLSDPEWLQQARERPDVVQRAVEESLRLEPAAVRVDRYATADTVLAGQPIRRRDLVIASLAAANRDPASWPDPDRYDPGRFDPERHASGRSTSADQLAFAHGPHACLAADLARWQAVAVLRELLRLPDLRLDPGRCDPPRGLVFRKPDRVAVTWTPRPSPLS